MRLLSPHAAAQAPALAALGPYLLERQIRVHLERRALPAVAARAAQPAAVEAARELARDGEVRRALPPREQLLPGGRPPHDRLERLGLGEQEEVRGGEAEAEVRARVHRLAVVLPAAGARARVRKAPHREAGRGRGDCERGLLDPLRVGGAEKVLPQGGAVAVGERVGAPEQQRRRLVRDVRAQVRHQQECGGGGQQRDLQQQLLPPHQQRQRRRHCAAERDERLQA
mmetsp:Transcript_24063/g.71310  ORF Transcript_24063/g.71310 Transcript_24063/m.71310 type:complete len:227 (-) Transcript_24063:444-1124(-)